MVSTQLRILRVFGLTAAEVTAILREAQADGCTGLRLLERDGEFAVCVQASAPTQAMADAHCEKWAQRLAARFGDAVYATGETSLAQATLDALLKKRRLLVAADEMTGRLVGALLQPLPHSEAAFDFGTHTYADPVSARKIITPPTLLTRFPGDVVQAAAGRTQLALSVGQADCALCYMPATVGQAPFVLLCDRRGAAACAVSPELSDAALGNALLDLVRRRVLGLKLPAGAIQFRPGHEHPLLLVSPAGQQKGDTSRFSLRRKGSRAGFEPMMDFDTAQLPPTTKAAAAAAVAAAVQPAQAQPDGAPPADVAAAARAAAERDWAADAPRTPAGAPRSGGITFEDDAGTPPAGRQTPQAAPPLDFATAGAENAAAHRAVRTAAGRRPAGAAGAAKQPPHSILDDDLPDLTKGLDPEAVRAARQADDAAPPRSVEDLQSVARRLYDDAEPEDVADPTKNRSLARIEKAERRQRRTMAAVFALILLLVAAGAAALVWYFSTSLGAQPAARGYGTAQFDDAAGDYLANAAAKRQGVAGYLTFPGSEGLLLYAPGAATAEDAAPAAQLQGENWLGAGTASNTVLTLPGETLAALTELETLRDNAGFTLYLADGTYRCQTLAVYYSDPDTAGGTAFVPAGGQFASYTAYLDFVLGAHARSLYDTGIALRDGDSFLTLVGTPDADGVSLCVTGRVIPQGEDAQLAPALIEAQASPLLPAARRGSDQPDLAALLAAQLEWYAAASNARPAAAPEAGDDPAQAGEEAADDDDLSQSIADLQAETDQMMSEVDTLLAGLTDMAGQQGAAESDLHQGAEGTLPEQEVPVEQVTATPAPTATPQPEQNDPPEQSDPPQQNDGGSQPTPAPDNGNQGDQGSAPAETINVTMNGSQQTLDLVTCLAMIAQNELGANAPAEAYKAQCVAAHCWILSQGGYPSVAGTTPGAAATAAAQEVAHVLITYGGNVCFTPYFASASTGTASAADVWGGDRAWLQAVESPYDQTTASHWNTNGATSGTARFSRATLQQRILEKLGIDLSGVDPNSWFKILSANQYGWVSQMQIGPDGGPNTTCRGSWFRETLLAGQSVDGRSLRSQCFTVSYDAGSDCFLFDVYGYGHGVGMSQWGAVGYANNGWTYQQILQHYYPGTSLTTY